MNSRRKAREVALQALYQCDIHRDWNFDLIATYFKAFHNLDDITKSKNENFQFALELISGVIDHLEFLDKQIATASTHWSINRMSMVDRNIIRFTCYEIGFINDIPTRVSINEAIEISKQFGTDDSPMFVNGVLDNVATLFSKSPNLVKDANLANLKSVANG